MGITPVRGRLFTAADDEKAPLVVVVNDTMAGRYWPGEDALGKRFHLTTDDVPWLTIVGVIPTVGTTPSWSRRAPKLSAARAGRRRARVGDARDDACDSYRMANPPR